MSSNKVFRVKIYRRLSGPFEAVVTASSRKKAQTKVMLKAAKAYKAEMDKLAHEHTAPGLDKPDLEAVAGGIVYHMPKPTIGKPFYKMSCKLAKPKKIGKSNELLKCDITLLGKAV